MKSNLKSNPITSRSTKLVSRRSILAASIAVLFAGCFTKSSPAQGQPYGATIQMNAGGYHYVECFNLTNKRISIEFSYIKKYAVGEPARIEGTAIVEAGERGKVAVWCAIPAPTEQMYDLKIHNIRNME